MFKILKRSEKWLTGQDKLHLLGHEAELFSRQEVELEDKPPVKVAVSIQRPVVDISLLLVFLHARHPADNRNNRGEL